MLHQVLLFAITAGEADKRERWSAVSNTAMSITGDVTFTPTHLTFSNGKALAVQFVGIHAIPKASDATDGASHFDVYRVVSRGNLILLNHNTICGQPPTFVTILHSSSSADVFVNFYEGSAAPSRNWNDPRNLCASYTYAFVK
jgi:hypothetical protein